MTDREMSNWIREKAHAEANVWHDPCELWSALRISIQEAVDTWTRIYGHPGGGGVVVSSLARDAGTSFTVRLTSARFGAVGRNSLQVAFDQSQNLIHVTPQPYTKTFHIYLDQAHNRVGLKQQDIPSSRDLLIEDACRLILEPLIDSLGHRYPIRSIDP
jgi:hypothetical protein